MILAPIKMLAYCYFSGVVYSIVITSMEYLL